MTQKELREAINRLNHAIDNWSVVRETPGEHNHTKRNFCFTTQAVRD